MLVNSIAADGATLCHIPNMTEKSPEPELLRKLMAVKPDNLSPNKWAIDAGVNRTVFADIRRNGSARMETIEKLLDAVDISWAQFDAALDPDPQPRGEVEPAVRAPAATFGKLEAPRDVPVMGTAHGQLFSVGDNGVEVEQTIFEPASVVDHVRRPAGISDRKDVFAVWIQGESMAPRYEPGDLAYIDPRRPPMIGDYVLVQLAEHDEDSSSVVTALVKRLVRRNSGFVELEQFNPTATFQLDTPRIHSILRIIPMRELLGY